LESIYTTDYEDIKSNNKGVLKKNCRAVTPFPAASHPLQWPHFSGG
jgi:hypothetical protein